MGIPNPLHHNGGLKHLYDMNVVSAVGLTSAVVASAAAGDREAFARIVSEHHDDMVRVAFLVSGDADLAHDATQSAWAIAWRKLADLRELDRLRPWLVSIAANEARQLVRRRQRRSIREIDLAAIAETDAFDAVTGLHDETLDLMNALSRLEPGDREILAMRYALGLTSDEIGQAVGLSAPGVRSRQARSINRLRKALSDE